MGWGGVSPTPQPHFTPGKDPVLIVREAEWAPGSVWTSGKSRPHWDSNPDRPARCQSLYRLSYPAHWKQFELFGIFKLSDLPNLVYIERLERHVENGWLSTRKMMLMLRVTISRQYGRVVVSCCC